MLNLSSIRAAAKAGRIKWRYHALLRAYQRGISREQAHQVINMGEIIEQRPRARPFPKCLLMAMVGPDRPLYVSVGYDQARGYLHVITVHWLDPRKWEDPWTRTTRPPKLNRRRKRP
jgi:hypothetical protein